MRQADKFLYMSFSEYLRRVQNLPIIKRKIIFWSIIIILGLILCSLYIINIRNRIKTFPFEKSIQYLKFPDIKTGVEKMPKFETGGGMEELKNNIQEAEKMIEENSGQK